VNIQTQSYIGNRYPIPTVSRLISISFVPACLACKVEIIQLQALLKLRMLGYTVSHIDAEMVLPQAEVPNTDADGLFWTCKQRCAPPTCLPTLLVTIVRDLLEWPGMLKDKGEGVRVIRKWDVVSRVDSMLRQFCPLLGCIQPACPSHSMYPITHPDPA